MAGRNISLCTLDIYTTTFWNIRALLGLQVFLAHGLFLLENNISYRLPEYSYILRFSHCHIQYLYTYEFEKYNKFSLKQIKFEIMYLKQTLLFKCIISVNFRVAKIHQIKFVLFSKYAILTIQQQRFNEINLFKLLCLPIRCSRVVDTF